MSPTARRQSFIILACDRFHLRGSPTERPSDSHQQRQTAGPLGRPSRSTLNKKFASRFCHSTRRMQCRTCAVGSRRGGLASWGGAPRGARQGAPRRQRCQRGSAERRSGGPRCQGAKVTKDRQVLRFTDPSSGVEVVLVGTMHYNPSSIGLAASTVRQLVEQDALGALVLETCPTRWAKMMEVQAPGSALRTLLDNEFQAAQEAANGSGAALVLGDQRIQDLGKAVKSLASSTMTDLVNPIDGWPRLFSDIRDGWKREVSGMGTNGLALTDLLDPRLILSAPVSLARYPMSWLIKSPASAAALFSFTAGLDYLADHVPTGAIVSGSYVSTPEETAVTVFFAALEVVELVLFSRLFLVALLGRRNDILAGSILEACREAKSGTAVVAILGAAHLNGVQHRLLSGSASPQTDVAPTLAEALVAVAEVDASA